MLKNLFQKTVFDGYKHKKTPYLTTQMELDMAFFILFFTTFLKFCYNK